MVLFMFGILLVMSFIVFLILFIFSLLIPGLKNKRKKYIKYGVPISLILGWVFLKILCQTQCLGYTCFFCIFDFFFETSFMLVWVGIFYFIYFIVFLIKNGKLKIALYLILVILIVLFLLPFVLSLN